MEAGKKSGGKVARERETERGELMGGGGWGGGWVGG